MPNAYPTAIDFYIPLPKDEVLPTCKKGFSAPNLKLAELAIRTTPAFFPSDKSNIDDGKKQYAVRIMVDFFLPQRHPLTEVQTIAENIKIHLFKGNPPEGLKVKVIKW